MKRILMYVGLFVVVFGIGFALGYYWHVLGTSAQTPQAKTLPCSSMPSPLQRLQAAGAEYLWTNRDTQKQFYDIASLTGESVDTVVKRMISTLWYIREYCKIGYCVQPAEVLRELHKLVVAWYYNLETALKFVVRNLCE